MKANTIEDFWKKVELIPFHSCWEWTKGCTEDGYGQFKIEGVSYKAHRFSYELRFGPIPKDMQVCHSCDNPSCVNPDHLFLGTAKDNIKDCVNKKRNAFGEKNWKSKLSDLEVNEIKTLFASGEYTWQSLAEIYGVTRRTIGNYISNKTRNNQ